MSIERWLVPNLEDMSRMFSYSGYNSPIQKLKIPKVRFMNKMFSESPFNQCIREWCLSGVESYAEYHPQHLI